MTVTNDEYIRAISACDGDPAKIAIVQADHVAGMIGRRQLDTISLQVLSDDLAELSQRFADHETQDAETARMGQAYHADIRQFLSELATQLQQLVERQAAP